MEHLRSYWYLIDRSKHIGAKMRRMFVLNTPLVLFRDKSGAVRAFLDYCPHRGVPLSDGRIVNNRIECCYHGWQFNCEGTCECIPALQKAPKFSLKKVAAVEQGGYVFVNLGNEKAQAFAGLPDLTGFHQYYWKRTVRGELVEAVENFLDATHTPFIHKYLIRNPKNPKKQNAHISRLGQSVTIRYTDEEKQSGLIARLFEKDRLYSDAHFAMPSIAEINYYTSAGLNFKIRAHITPKSNHENDVHVLFYMAKGAVPGFLKYLMAWPFFQMAFAQDKKIVESQLINQALIPGFAPIYGEADLIRRHLVDLIVHEKFTDEKIDEGVKSIYV